MRSTSPVARCRIWRRFPPEGASAWHQTILHELRAKHVRSSRGRVVSRGVKRKMSNYPLRPRKRQRIRRVDYRVRILK